MNVVEVYLQGLLTALLGERLDPVSERWWQDWRERKRLRERRERRHAKRMRRKERRRESR